MSIIAGFGNPLLDLTIKIEDDRLLRKYNLKMDDQAQIPEDQMKSLLEDIKDFSTTHTPGGSVQNTLRVFQWLTRNQDYRTYMIGAIGNDENGERIKNLVTNDGVITKYFVSEEKPTGVTVALVQNISRSLVAHIGAAETFTLNNFHQITKEGLLLESVDLFYIEGFFITERHEVTTHIVQYVRSKKKLLMYNLSAQYVCLENPDMVKYIVDSCDILIGNINEFHALIQICEPGCDPLKFALNLNKSSAGRSDFKYGKMILITDGPNPITCIYGQGKTSIMPIEYLPQEKVKDTTGAGDAFVAGIIAGLFKNYTPEECMRYGSRTALHIIQQIGCKIPDCLPDFH